MGSKQDQIELAKMLERYEDSLGHLYQTYAHKFPETAEFWNDISTEERTHAFMVRTFRTMIEDGTLVYEDRPFAAKEVEAYIKELKEHLDYARRNEMSLTEAASIALEMENRVLEKNIFEIYEGDSDELKRTLKTLNEDTKRHYEKIRKLYEEHVGE